MHRPMHRPMHRLPKALRVGVLCHQSGWLATCTRIEPRRGEHASTKIRTLYQRACEVPTRARSHGIQIKIAERMSIVAMRERTRCGQPTVCLHLPGYTYVRMYDPNEGVQRPYPCRRSPREKRPRLRLSFSLRLHAPRCVPCPLISIFPCFDYGHTRRYSHALCVHGDIPVLARIHPFRESPRRRIRPRVSDIAGYIGSLYIG